jgi:predicted transglutaminase-like cysteine proteinase
MEQTRRRECSPSLFSDCPFDEWRRFLKDTAERDRWSQLVAVNAFMNARRYVADERNWGVSDYWATPGEFMSRAGDCEDFAIAKYLSLVGTGMPTARLRLVYVRARPGIAGGPATGSPHMVLAYFARPADPLILDNLGGRILPASQRPDLRPVFSFNAEGLWQGIGNIRAGNPLRRLTPWPAVLQRAREEGFL